MKQPRDLPTYPVHVRVLPSGGFPVEISATPQEAALVARFCAVPAIRRLSVSLTVKHWRSDGVSVAGKLRATVERECVVTLAPVDEEIDITVERTFVPQGSPLAKPKSGGEWIIDPLGPDTPDSFAGDEIDIWAIVAECLVLALDPFPRVAGAVFEGQWPPQGKHSSVDNSPFAALAARKPTV